MLSMSTVVRFACLPCVCGVEIAVVGVFMALNKGEFLLQIYWNAQDHSLVKAVSSYY